MDGIAKRIRRLKEFAAPYITSRFDITRYQIVSALILAGLSFLLRQLAMLLIRSSGRVAVSTGDFDLLFKTWQGPLLIVVGLLTLFVYVAFDLNTQIIYASRLLKGEQNLLASIREGFLSIRSFLTPDGIGIVVYIALIAPIVGFGFTISLTDSLYIPEFISSVIYSVPAYHALYILFVISFAIFGIINIFTIHGILLDGLKSYDADNESRKLMKANWKDFLVRHLKIGLFLVSFIVLMTIALVFAIICLFFLIRDEKTLKVILIALTFLFSIVTVYISSIMKFNYMIWITSLYYKYKGVELTFTPRKRKGHYVLSVLSTLCFFAVLIMAALFIDQNFDQLFMTEIKPRLIAHRAGGIEAPENTIAGIEKAIALEAAGSEIDVQRTRDGYYVINHDSTFHRLCGNRGRPEELMLEQIRELTIRDPLFPGTEEPVPTLEEMLEAARGKIILFIELKGSTADNQMADDVVNMIKERNMEEDCVIISLKYPLIRYIEETYPEIQTGYLTFASFGNIEQLECDFIGLEESAASRSNIDAIHNAGKKAMVWTPNEEESQKRFLLSDADYIITDRITQAREIIERLNDRSDLSVILDLTNLKYSN